MKRLPAAQGNLCDSCGMCLTEKETSLNYWMENES